MVTDNVLLYNVAESVNEEDGVTLYRFPLDVIGALSVPEFSEKGQTLHIGHREAARSTVGVEIRFVSEGEEMEIELRSEKPFEVIVYTGDFQVGIARLSEGKHRLNFSRREMRGVKERSRFAFATKVWRVFLSGAAPVTLCGICAGDIRPPKREELPAVRMLAYGSSITYGCRSLDPTLSYIHTAAQALGVDVLNKGIAGGCFCEEEMLAYLLTEQFDFGVFELGTNIANRPLPFLEERLGKFIDGICSTAKKPLFFLTSVRGISDLSDEESKACYKEYFATTRALIARHVANFATAHLLDGCAVAARDSDLSADVLHPSGFGHVMMGMRLARMLAPYLRSTAAEPFGSCE